MLSTLPSTQQQLEDKETGVFVPSYNQIADAIGASKNKYHRIRTEKQVKKDLLELRGETNGVIPTGTIFSQIVKSKGWTKVDKDLEAKVHSFIQNHPNVVQSPIMNDYVSVKDKDDPSVVHKVPKLLLQVSI